MYILKCNDATTGSTKNLEKRIEEHNNGEGANYTRKRLSVELIYYEEYHRVDLAFQREKQVQGWSRKKRSLDLWSARRITEINHCISGYKEIDSD